MVLSTALFGKPAFRNLVCNGLVLAADGKKMSKRLRNYPVRALDAPQAIVMASSELCMYYLGAKVHLTSYMNLSSAFNFF